jgi:hypothetical protein
MRAAAAPPVDATSGAINDAYPVRECHLLVATGRESPSTISAAGRPNLSLRANPA